MRRSWRDAYGRRRCYVPCVLQRLNLGGWMMKALVLAATFILFSGDAFAACPFQTVTFTIQPANLTATTCISTNDATLLNTALASPLIAAGNPSPTSLQEWVEATQIMSNA